MLEKLVALKEIYKLRIVMRLRKIAMFTVSVFLVVALTEV